MNCFLKNHHSHSISTTRDASSKEIARSLTLKPGNLTGEIDERTEKEDLADISAWWQEHLRGLVHDLPSEWIDNVASKLKKVCGKSGCLTEPA